MRQKRVIPIRVLLLRLNVDFLHPRLAELHAGFVAALIQDLFYLLVPGDSSLISANGISRPGLRAGLLPPLSAPMNSRRGVG